MHGDRPFSTDRTGSDLGSGRGSAQARGRPGLDAGVARGRREIVVRRVGRYTSADLHGPSSPSHRSDGPWGAQGGPEDPCERRMRAVDTNVLVRLVTRDDPGRWPRRRRSWRAAHGSPMSCWSRPPGCSTAVYELEARDRHGRRDAAQPSRPDGSGLDVVAAALEQYRTAGAGLLRLPGPRDGAKSRAPSARDLRPGTRQARRCTAAVGTQEEPRTMVACSFASGRGVPRLLFGAARDRRKKSACGQDEGCDEAGRGCQILRGVTLPTCPRDSFLPPGLSTPRSHRWFPCLWVRDRLKRWRGGSCMR